MPSSWQARMIRTAISPRLAIRILVKYINALLGPARLALLQECPHALLSLGAAARGHDRLDHIASRRVAIERPDRVDQALGRAGGLRPTAQQLPGQAGDGRIQLLGADDSVDQPERAGALGGEALAADEQRPRLADADLWHGILPDTRRDQTDLYLAEAEACRI